MVSTKHYEAKRRAEKPWRAWYRSKEWKAKAADCIARHPICAICSKAPSKIADHITPHRGDPARFWDGKLQGLCTSCHNSIKQSMERRNAKPIGADGWPIGS